MGILVFIITLSAFISFSATSRADIYKYIDDKGVIHYTNTPSGKGYKKIITEKRRTQSRKIRSRTSHAYNHIVNEVSEKYDVEPSLVNAVIEVESNWDSRAVSRKGAQGLMQLMPATARQLNVRDPFDPGENIEGGIRYLRYLLDRYNGDLSLALAAYNAGPERIKKNGDIPRIPETRNYVKKVLSIYNGKGPGKKRRTHIYRIVKEDGTVLYTNTPVHYRNYTASRL